MSICLVTSDYPQCAIGLGERYFRRKLASGALGRDLASPAAAERLLGLARNDNSMGDQRRDGVFVDVIDELPEFPRATPPDRSAAGRVWIGAASSVSSAGRTSNACGNCRKEPAQAIGAEQLHFTSQELRKRFFWKLTVYVSTFADARGGVRPDDWSEDSGQPAHNTVPKYSRAVRCRKP
jgi:hypothetical protein